MIHNLNIKTMISTLIGGAIAALVVYNAWINDSLCEIHCGEVINWGPWFLIGLTWFFPVFVVVLVMIIVISKTVNF